MNKLTITLAIALACMTGACSGDKVTKDVNELPQTAQKFIADNFDAKVSQIEIDKDLTGDDYEVILNDGTKVDFDSKGTWDKIEAPYGQSIPEALVPTAITEYMAKNYEGHSIVKIDKDDNGYEVELQNGLELHFDANGTFCSVDD
ncbi:MAG: PepSY-like domain-containing protein [Muribaculaceae bacterium]|nr:PepSY-like domain-containing protein [Muribaculaceae bacterium]